MKDQSDNPSHHEQMLLLRSYISLPWLLGVRHLHQSLNNVHTGMQWWVDACRNVYVFVYVWIYFFWLHKSLKLVMLDIVWYVFAFSICDHQSLHFQWVTVSIPGEIQTSCSWSQWKIFLLGQCLQQWDLDFVCPCSFTWVRTYVQNLWMILITGLFWSLEGSVKYS